MGCALGGTGKQEWPDPCGRGDTWRADGFGPDPCGRGYTTRAAAVRAAGARPPLPIRCHEPYYSGNEADSGGEPDVAAFDIPIYNKFSRFEAEFYAPDICKDEFGTPTIALQLRVRNDANDMFEDAKCDSSSSSTALWRNLEIKNINLRPIHFNADEWEKGLADYQWLASMTPLPDCIEGQDCFEPVAGCVWVDPDVPGVLTRLSKAETLGTADADMECLGQPVNSGASTVATGVMARELWHAPAVASDESPPMRRAGAYFFVPDRPDEVRPWTVVRRSALPMITAKCLPRPPNNSPPKASRLWFGIRVGRLSSGFEAGTLRITVPYEDWRVYSVIYEPVPVNSQYWTDATIPPASSGFEGAYQIQPVLLAECRTPNEGSVFDRVCEPPFEAGTSRAMLLEIPPGDGSHAYCGIETPFSLFLESDSGVVLHRLLVGLEAVIGDTFSEPKIVMYDSLPDDDVIDLESANLSAESQNVMTFFKKYGLTHLLANYGFWGDDAYVANPDYDASVLEDYDVSVRLTAAQLNLTDEPTGEDQKGVSFTAIAQKADYYVNSGGNKEAAKGTYTSLVGVLEEVTYVRDQDEPVRELAVGDYVTCGLSNTAKPLGRIGAIIYGSGNLPTYILDVPFKRGECTGDQETFHPVFVSGELDKQILHTMDIDFDGDYPTNFHQGTYCNEADDTLFPITCDRPMVTSLSWTNYDIFLECQDYDYSGGEDLIVTGTCGIDSTLTGPQKEFLLDGSGSYPGLISSIRDLAGGGKLGEDPILVPANYYDETKSFGSLTGLFDGFGQVNLDSFLRFLQTQGETSEEAQWDTLSMVTDRFVYYWHRQSAIVDSDGDLVKDAEDPCPFMATEDPSKCEGRGPFLADQVNSGVSEYANSKNYELIGDIHHEFYYAGGYDWGVKNPLRSRAHGLLWRKASDERDSENGETENSATLPNLVIHPCAFGFRYIDLIYSAEPDEPSYRDAIGTWDSFALLDAGMFKSTPKDLPVFRSELPFLLSDGTGSYVGWDGQMDAIIHSAVAELEYDAGLLVKQGINLSSDDAFPYGSRWFKQNRAESVCSFEKITQGNSGTYNNIAQECRDYVTTSKLLGR